MTIKYFTYLLTFLLLSMADARGQSQAVSSLKFLNEYEVPFNKPFKNTSIGGLSGIDYAAANDVYYLISDDRSAINPARFYTAKISLTAKGIDSVEFVGMQYFLQADGSTYPSSKTDPAHAPDPESIRYNPQTSQVIWTSEGERTKKQDHFILQDPAIIISNQSGKHQSNFPIASNLVMRQDESGARQNGALEGISFSTDYQFLYASMEEPLYDDGPRADVEKNNAVVRICKYDAATKQQLVQYAYPLEPIAYPPSPTTGFKVNGISEILALDKNKLLVVERSFSWGRLACTVKVFIANLVDASNVAEVKSLQGKSTVKLIQKKLLLNMDDLKIYIDNIEGITFGPALPNGHRTLIFVSDNNFSAIEKTQFLLFEVIP